MQRSGVEIYKRFYPWPERFRLGDPVLVREVTGMDWPEFVAALQEQEEELAQARESNGTPPDMDQVLLAGLIAVAFWQGNPQMTRDKARRAIERCGQDQIELIEGEEEEPEENPPSEAAGEPQKQNSRPSADSPADEEKTEILPVST